MWSGPSSMLPTLAPPTDTIPDDPTPPQVLDLLRRQAGLRQDLLGVLPQARRGPGCRAALTEPDRRSRPDRAPLDLDDHPARPDLGIGHRLGHVVHRPHAGLQPREPLDPLVPRPRLERLLEPAGHLVLPVRVEVRLDEASAPRASQRTRQNLGSNAPTVTNLPSA